MSPKKSTTKPGQEAPDSQGELDKTIEKSGSEAQNEQPGSPPTDESNPAPTQEEIDAAEEAAAKSSAHDDPPADETAPADPQPPVDGDPVPPAEVTLPDGAPSTSTVPAEVLGQDPAPPEGMVTDPNAPGDNIPLAAEPDPQGISTVRPASADPDPDDDETKAKKNDPRQPAEKEPGPPPVDQVTLDVAVVKPADTLEEVSKAMPPKEHLTTLDEADSARAAALRRQRDWARDSEKFFPEETKAVKDQKALVQELDRMDGDERRRVEKETAERKRKEELETRDERIAELKAKLDSMRKEAEGYIDEIERLEALTA